MTSIYVHTYISRPIGRDHIILQKNVPLIINLIKGRSLGFGPIRLAELISFEIKKIRFKASLVRV